MNRRRALRRRPSPPLIAIAAVAVALSSCTACARRGQLADTGENVSSVLRQADRRMGQEVTVVGRVHEVISAKSFTITDGVELVLVLGVATMPALDNDLDGVLTNEQARVTGELRVLRIGEIESEVGELIDARYERFIGEPVVVADVVTPRQPRSEHRRAGLRSQTLVPDAEVLAVDPRLWDAGGHRPSVDLVNDGDPFGQGGDGGLRMRPLAGASRERLFESVASLPHRPCHGRRRLHRDSVSPVYTDR